MSLATEEAGSELITHVQQVLDDSQKTTSEKLQALEHLEKLPRQEAIDVLKQIASKNAHAIAQDKGFKIVQLDEDLPSADLHAMRKAVKKNQMSDTEKISIQTLRVAERAARALANNDNPSGIQFLKDSLAFDTQHPEIRYLAALGLGGTTSEATFEAFNRGLHDSNPTVRERVVQSLKESLDKLAGGGNHRPDVISALQGLAALGLLVGREGNPEEDRGSIFARFILKQHNVPDVINWLIRQLTKLEDGARVTLCFELMGNQLSVDAYHQLADILRTDGCSSLVYRRIALLLRSSNDSYIKQVAEETLRQKRGICARLFDKFIAKPELDDARSKAAMTILAPGSGPNGIN